MLFFFPSFASRYSWILLQFQCLIELHERCSSVFAPKAEKKNLAYCLDLHNFKMTTKAPMKKKSRA